MVTHRALGLATLSKSDMDVGTGTDTHTKTHTDTHTHRHTHIFSFFASLFCSLLRAEFDEQGNLVRKAARVKTFLRDDAEVCVCVW